MRSFSLVLAFLLWVLSLTVLVRIGLALAFGGVGDLMVIGPLLSRTGWAEAAPMAVLLVSALVLVELFVQGIRVARENATATELAARLTESEFRATGLTTLAKTRTRAGRRAQLIANAYASQG